MGITSSVMICARLCTGTTGRHVDSVAMVTTNGTFDPECRGATNMRCYRMTQITVSFPFLLTMMGDSVISILSYNVVY